MQVEGSVWLPLNVVSNGNVSSSSQAVGVTKIAKSVIAPLAEQHVSVFMLSTYQTDFILVSPAMFKKENTCVLYSGILSHLHNLTMYKFYVLAAVVLLLTILSY